MCMKNGNAANNNKINRLFDLKGYNLSITNLLLRHSCLVQRSQRMLSMNLHIFKSSSLNYAVVFFNAMKATMSMAQDGDEQTNLRGKQIISNEL